MLNFWLDYEIVQKAYKFLLTEFIDAKTKHVAKMKRLLLGILPGFSGQLFHPCPAGGL